MTTRCLTGVVVAAAALLWPLYAYAQDKGPGAERIEIGAGIFGGGAMIVPSSAETDPLSHSYIISGAVAANVNKWFGFEGEVSWVASHGDAHEVFGVVPVGPKAPSMLMYGGNVLYSPFASDRRFVPYASASLGALTTFDVAAGSTFAFPGNRTFLTAGGGGGARWFPIRHWGVRGDYRILYVDNDAAGLPPEARQVNWAQRVYGALVLTF